MCAQIFWENEIRIKEEEREASRVSNADVNIRDLLNARKKLAIFNWRC